MVATLVVLAAGTAGSVRAFVYPTTERPLPTDAVVLLAGSPESRLPLAVDLAAEGPHVLVVSAADGDDNEPARGLCGSPPRGLTVYCFTPSAPENTHSEAEAIGRLTARHGWSRITVVTSTYHVVRAGLLVRRCTSATVAVSGAEPSISGVQWTFYVLKELAGVLVATVVRGC